MALKALSLASTLCLAQGTFSPVDGNNNIHSQGLSNPHRGKGTDGKCKTSRRSDYTWEFEIDQGLNSAYAKAKSPTTRLHVRRVEEDGRWGAPTSANVAVSFLLEKEGTDGWLSLGFPTTEEGRKNGTNAYAYVYSTSLSQDGWYNLGNKDPNYIVRENSNSAVSSAAVNFTNASAYVEGGSTWLEVHAAERMMTAWDWKGEYHLIWAAHPDDNHIFPYGLLHTIAARIKINSRSCEYEVSNWVDFESVRLVRLHASMMIVGWLLLLPLAIIFKRYGDKLGLGKECMCGPRTAGFCLHIILALSAIVMIWCAVIIALTNDTDARARSRGHRAMGLFLVVAILVQPFIGLTANMLDIWVLGWVHRIHGYILIFCIAVSQMITGTENFKDYWHRDYGWPFQTAIGAMVGSIFIVFFYLEFCYKNPNEEEELEEEMEEAEEEAEDVKPYPDASAEEKPKA